MPGIRPALLDEPLRADLDLLRRFRHRVRHAYAEEYDWSEMQDTVAAARRVAGSFPAAVDAFRRFLLETARALEEGAQ